MFPTQFFVLALIAALVAIPCVLWIPRQRQSPWFDRVLWISTWLLALLSASAAPKYLGAFAALNNLVIADLPFLPTLIGAGVGALLIPLTLWLLDRVSAPEMEPELDAPIKSDHLDAGITLAQDLDADPHTALESNEQP